MSGLWDIYRQTDGHTDQLTDKGDYYGPHRVNPGFKMKFLHVTYKEISSKVANFHVSKL